MQFSLHAWIPKITTATPLKHGGTEEAEEGLFGQERAPPSSSDTKINDGLAPARRPKWNPFKHGKSRNMAKREEPGGEPTSTETNSSASSVPPRFKGFSWRRRSSRGT